MRGDGSLTESEKAMLREFRAEMRAVVLAVEQAMVERDPNPFPKFHLFSRGRRKS